MSEFGSSGNSLKLKKSAPYAFKIQFLYLGRNWKKNFWFVSNYLSRSVEVAVPNRQYIVWPKKMLVSNFCTIMCDQKPCNEGDWALRTLISIQRLLHTLVNEEVFGH